MGHGFRNVPLICVCVCVCVCVLFYILLLEASRGQKINIIMNERFKWVRMKVRSQTFAVYRMGAW